MFSHFLAKKNLDMTMLTISLAHNFEFFLFNVGVLRPLQHKVIVNDFLAIRSETLKKEQ